MEKAKKTAPSAHSTAKTPVAHGVGRRKSSVARAWLRRGHGDIIVNGKKSNEYFDVEVNRTAAALPFVICAATSKSYDVEVNVQGGGVTSQAGAVQLSIARALVEYDETLKPALRKSNLLTVDSRVKERKKYGQKSARAKFQFVKR